MVIVEYDPGCSTSHIVGMRVVVMVMVRGNFSSAEYGRAVGGGS